MEEKNMDPKQFTEHETNRRTFLKTSAAAAGAVLLGTTLTSTTAFAKEKDKDAKDKEQDKQDDNLEKVELLFVQSALNVVGSNDHITLKGINPQTIFFSDRPKRIAGHMDT